MFTKRIPRAALLGGAAVAVAATMAPSATTHAAAASSLPRNAIAMPTLYEVQAARAQLGDPTADCVLPIIIGVTCVSAGQPMTYGGGPIQTAPKVFIVFWGWNGRDPSGQAAYQERFFEGIGGGTWNASQTQYCDSTTLFGLRCNSGANLVGNPNPVFTTANIWNDNTNAVPNQPDDAAIQAEAARAASFFGTTSGNAQFVIDTPQGNSTSGFGTQWCAYHGITSGGLSYTDFPYISDAGGSCGENIVNSGSAGVNDGVSIVGGHEFAEAETDPSPPNGWTDEIGAETGDKCAWITIGPGSVTDISLSTGSFAVQSLWSNNDNSGTGGCVTFYSGPGNQH